MTVSIEIDAPRSAWEYDQWIWVLHHEHLELYVERPERWYLHIETRCTQLNEQGRCRIHGRHPVLCRDYDPRTCERRAPLSDVLAWFKTAEDFERWLQQRRPSHWKRLLAYREAPPPGAARSGTAALAHALVTIAEPTAHEPATRRPRRRP